MNSKMEKPKSDVINSPEVPEDGSESTMMEVGSQKAQILTAERPEISAQKVRNNEEKISVFAQKTKLSPAHQNSSPASEGRRRSIERKTVVTTFKKSISRSSSATRPRLSSNNPRIAVQQTLKQANSERWT
jgi:hypothetical protein